MIVFLCEFRRVPAIPQYSDEFSSIRRSTLSSLRETTGRFAFLLIIYPDGPLRQPQGSRKLHGLLAPALKQCTLRFDRQIQRATPDHGAQFGGPVRAS